MTQSGNNISSLVASNNAATATGGNAETGDGSTPLAASRNQTSTVIGSVTGTNATAAGYDATYSTNTTDAANVTDALEDVSIAK